MSVSLTHYQQVGKVASDDMSNQSMLYRSSRGILSSSKLWCICNIIMKWLAYIVLRSQNIGWTSCFESKFVSQSVSSWLMVDVYYLSTLLEDNESTLEC